jgi:Ankyrin repeats (many copies)
VVVSTLAGVFAALLGRTPLHRVSCGSHIGVTTELLNWGADCNAQNADGSTPLHLAVTVGSYKVRTTAWLLIPLKFTELGFFLGNKLEIMLWNASC